MGIPNRGRGTYQGRKFKERSKKSSEPGRVNARNVNVQDLQRMLEQNTVEIEHVKDDMEAMQESNMNRGMSNMMKNQRAFNNLRNKNNQRESVLKRLLDERTSLERILTEDIGTQEAFEASLEGLDKAMAEERDRLELETTNSLILHHMQERADKEVNDGGTELQALERELEESEKELIACELNLRQVKQEKATERRELEALQRQLKDKKAMKDKKMQDVRRMIKQSKKDVDKQRRLVMDTINQLQEQSSRRTQGGGRGLGFDDLFSSNLSTASSTSLGHGQTNNNNYNHQDEGEGEEETKKPRKSKRRKKREVQKLLRKRDEYEQILKTFFTANLPFQAMIEQEKRESSAMEEDRKIGSFGHYPESNLVLKLLESQKSYFRDMKRNSHETMLSILTLREEVEKIEKALQHMRAEKNDRRVQQHQFAENKDLEMKKNQKFVEKIGEKQRIAELEVLEIANALARFLSKITKKTHEPPPISSFQDVSNMIIEEINKLKKVIKTKMINNSKENSQSPSQYPESPLAIPSPSTFSVSGSRRFSTSNTSNSGSNASNSSPNSVHSPTKKKDDLDKQEDDGFYAFQSIMNSPLRLNPENIRCSNQMKNQEEVDLRDTTSKMVTLLGVEETGRQLRKKQRQLENHMRLNTPSMGGTPDNDSSTFPFGSDKDDESEQEDDLMPSIDLSKTSETTFRDRQSNHTAAIYDQEDFVPERDQIKEIADMLKANHH